ncbi:hypothetical protein EJ08DRAFT_321851 [Tothia fuscella]|uniref:Uncharacterized protein n=1 Tax=Tothia fuscella TaxID=1048955 RepID=A0A9P4NMP4_9PEZI|nr:hypothetical protein EJ08DRAFT_321851 [Tothia fuscella]
MLVLFKLTNSTGLSLQYPLASGLHPAREEPPVQKPLTLTSICSSLEKCKSPLLVPSSQIASARQKRLHILPPLHPLHQRLHLRKRTHHHPWVPPEDRREKRRPP